MVFLVCSERWHRNRKTRRQKLLEKRMVSRIGLFFETKSERQPNANGWRSFGRSSQVIRKSVYRVPLVVETYLNVGIKTAAYALHIVWGSACQEENIKPCLERRK